MAAGAHLSKDFFDLVKSIGESKSKQEEDRIIVAEVGSLKRGLGDRTLTGKRLREYLIRVIYVEMLGHDASFGYMKAVEVRACVRACVRARARAGVCLRAAPRARPAGRRLTVVCTAAPRRRL